MRIRPHGALSGGAATEFRAEFRKYSRRRVEKYRSAVLLVVAMLCGARTANADAAPLLRCDYYKSINCLASGCTEATSKAWAIIDWGKKDYAFCESTGCQHFSFDPFMDGIYVSLTFPKRDLMFKLNTTDNSAVETGTFMNAAVISFGNCAKDEPPTP